MKAKEKANALQVPISAEMNSAIFEYTIVTVPLECLSTYMNYLGKYVIGPHVMFHVFLNGEFK